jgi:uncharacterized protein with NAD-binding domain and iron-sulfur cluster
LFYNLQKVAIIGGGIGAAGCVYYLTTYPKNWDIVVFEKEADVGGRVKHVIIGDAVFEVRALF